MEYNEVFGDESPHGFKTIGIGEPRVHIQSFKATARNAMDPAITAREASCLQQGKKREKSILQRATVKIL